MANDTTTTPGQAQAPPVTLGERLAGVAGVITASVILFICLDMALGGYLSAPITARLPRAADQGEDGCGC